MDPNNALTVRNVHIDVDRDSTDCGNVFFLGDIIRLFAKCVGMDYLVGLSLSPRSRFRPGEHVLLSCGAVWLILVGLSLSLSLSG